MPEARRHSASVRADLLRWIASHPPHRRDEAIERRLGIGTPVSSAAPGSDLVGYHASGVASIVRLFLEVPLGPDDVLVDLGSGLGKVVLLAALLTPARARGIELQPELAERARASARELGTSVELVSGDVRDAPLDDGTVFYLYAPFTGPVLETVIERLHAIAARRSIVVAALGIDLRASWLVPRELDAFWLSIYDSQLPGVAPRSQPPRERFDAAALAIALEQRLDGTAEPES